MVLSFEFIDANLFINFFKIHLQLGLQALLLYDYPSEATKHNSLTTMWEVLRIGNMRGTSEQVLNVACANLAYFQISLAALDH